MMSMFWNRYKGGASKYNSHKDVAPILDRVQTTDLLEDDILSSLTRLDTLAISKPEHPAIKYIEDRKIPRDKWYLLYFAPKFKTYTNTVIPKFMEPVEGRPSSNDHPILYKCW